MVLPLRAAAKELGPWPPGCARGLRTGRGLSWRWAAAAVLPSLMLSLGLGPDGAARADVLPGTVLQIGGAAPAADEAGGLAGLAGPEQVSAAGRAVGMGPSNLRFAVDLSSRAVYDDTADALALEQAVGVDVLHVFSYASGDLATLTAQVYLTRIDNQPRRPPAFEDDDDWALIYRILNLNVPVLDRGRMNVRVGHFELPYGLEHWVNTNGTLRTLTSVDNLGLMADWGVSVNGLVGGADYEVALTRGSGNGFSSAGDPWLVSGRVGHGLTRDLTVGLSGLVGELVEADPSDGRLGRSRVGVDVAQHVGPFTLLGEASVGEDDGRGVVGGLVELDYQTPHAAWLVYGQYRSQHVDRAAGGRDQAASAALGVRWVPDTRWALSAELVQETDALGDADRSRLFRTQVRFRF